MEARKMRCSAIMRSFTYTVFFFIFLTYSSFCQVDGYGVSRKESKGITKDWIKLLLESNHLNELPIPDSTYSILSNHSREPQASRRKMPFYQNMMNKIIHKNRQPSTPKDILPLKTASCISRYCVISTERLKQRQKERADTERSKSASVARKSLHSVFIGMHEKGQLPGASTSTEMLNTSFYKEMQQGSAFVIANCHLSIAYAESNHNNTVMTVMLDEGSRAKCERLISERKLTNIFVLVMSGKQMGEKLLSSQLFPTFINFDSLVIEEIGKITGGLLPHEVERLMSQMLQVSHQTIISFDVELEQERGEYFKSTWHMPMDLINNACARISNSSCTIKKIDGPSESWKASAFNVHLKKNASKEKSSHFKGFGVPLQYLLSINLTQGSKDALFRMLINSRINVGHLTNLFVKGQQVLEVLEKKEVEANESPVTQSLHLDKQKKLASLSNDPSSKFKVRGMRTNIFETNTHENFQENGDRKNFKDLGTETSLLERFEAQWNREENESIQKDLKDIENNNKNALRQAENEAFDIVDGRPIEEEKKIAEGYNFLKSNSLGYKSVKKGHLVENITTDGKIYKSYNGGDTRVILRTNKRETFYPHFTKAVFHVKHQNELKQTENKNSSLKPSDYSESGRKQIFKFMQQKKKEIHQSITTNPKTLDKSLKRVISGDYRKLKNNLDRRTETWRNGRKLLLMPPSWTPLPTKFIVDQNQLASLSKTERENALNRMLKMYDQYRGFTSSAITTSPTTYHSKPSQHPMISKPSQHSMNIKVSKEASNEDVYQSMKSIILANLKTVLRPNQISSALISGDCAFSMLSAKIAMLYPGISLVTLKSMKMPKCQDALRSLLKNNFHFTESLNPDIVYQMSHTPQLFDFQIISSHVFSWLLQMGEDLKHYMAAILSLSKVSYIEVTDWTHLVSSSKLFGRRNFIWKNARDFLNEVFSASSSWIRYLKIEDISTSSWKSLRGSSIYRIELSSIQRKVHPSCRGQPQILSNFLFEKFKSVGPQNNDKGLHFQQNGLNLKMLLSFELDSVYRKKMFVSYIKLNKYKDMCPSKLYWSQGKLWHEEDDMSVQYQHQSIKELTHVLNQDIHENNFSFMDYSSPNRHIGTYLAQFHLDSTFILAHPSSTEAAEKLKELKSKNLKNTIPLDLPVSYSFAENLVKSPDILRYQYFDFVSLLQSTYGKDEMNVKFMLGDILATGLTTFITMPSAEILSLAATTLYPTMFTENGTVTEVAPFFENAEQKLLMQSISTVFNIRLHTTLHPGISSTYFGQEFWFPWRLLSLRIMKLKIRIDHHFMFALDGHRRKYIQHVERKNITSPPEVYLLREEDSYRINYGNVNAISLIALLRMGLLSSMKKEFYGKFLQLPLYEDMAPWNIVFRAGKLDYIDQDTRDNALEKFLPMAYQVMSALMNYQRTVHDFGHCNASAKTVYNFNYMASCVESAFKGPCPDSRYPVPCGDKSCKSSYIECLRAMNKKMMHLNDSNERRGSNSHKKKFAFTNIWNFDGKGRTQIE